MIFKDTFSGRFAGRRFLKTTFPQSRRAAGRGAGWRDGGKAHCHSVPPTGTPRRPHSLQSVRFFEDGPGIPPSGSAPPTLKLPPRPVRRNRRTAALWKVLSQALGAVAAGAQEPASALCSHRGGLIGSSPIGPPCAAWLIFWLSLTCLPSPAPFRLPQSGSCLPWSREAGAGRLERSPSPETALLAHPASVGGVLRAPLSGEAARKRPRDNFKAVLEGPRTVMIQRRPLSEEKAAQGTEISSARPRSGRMRVKNSPRLFFTTA